MPGYRPPRRIGIAKDPATPSLLKTINNKPREQVIPAAQLTEAEVLAPPEDSETEPDSPVTSRREAAGPSKDADQSPQQTHSQKTSKVQQESDSEDDNSAWSARANISRPYYGTSKAGRTQAREFSASQESKSRSNSKRNSPGTDLPGQSSKKRKAVSRQSDEDSGDQQKKQRPISKPQRSFSQKDKTRDKRLAETARKQEEKKAAIRKKKARSPSPKIVQPSFKSYDDDPFEDFAGKTSPKRLVKPVVPLLSSPAGSPQRKFLAHSSLSPDASPQQSNKARLKLPSSLPEPLQSPKKERAAFRGLSSSPKMTLRLADDLFPDDTDSDLEDVEMKPITEARCPMCKVVVKNELLESFSKGARLSIQRQIQFCRLHKKKSAEAAWETRGYPVIDWDGLGGRLRHHYDFLENIVNGGKSHYRDLLSDVVKEGKNRTLLKAEGNLTPGYYGPRGLRALSEGIIGRFSSALRKRAMDDRLISSRGYSSFVEAVLVPELAIRLICEDMHVKTSDARTILEESKWIGDLLHEDTGDTVDQLSDDEKDEC